MAILGPKFVCLIFCWLGCIYLQPFNTIVNLYDYYEHQDLPLPTSSYISLLNAIFQLSAITTNGILLCPKKPFNHKEAIVLYTSTTITIFLFILLALFTTLNIKGVSYLLVTLIFSCLLSVGSSVNDSLNLFLVEKVSSTTKPLLPYLTGINITGTFNSLVLLLIQTLSSDYVLVARCYFLITACVIVLAIPIYRHILKTEVPSSEEEEEEIDSDASEASNVQTIVKVIYPYIILVFLNFTITLFIYPQMALRSNPPVNSPIYHTVIVFFLFNFSALCGNLLALKFSTSNILKVYLILLSRTTFSVPFFVCYQVNSVYDLMNNYTFLCIFLSAIMIMFTGFTSGYLASCAFYGAGKQFSSLQDKVLALRMVNFALSLGLTFGASLSYIFFNFIK